ncbi:MAG: hypothetical protein DRQ48_03810 [Gammaproteobacteria bacterium]|nr:MAG: hypothetical protein DRQ58_00685 [Gammaproteobacteria bacterium]RKZ71355.1 MAG: hypothetical protein DRQ48_03810 [Gammaproteobacteria bacterium]
MKGSLNKLFSKIISIILVLLPGISLSADVKTIEIQKEKNLYHIHINATVDADLDNVIRIITDYENLPLINPYLKESKLLDNPEDERSTVNMLTEICVLYLCYNIRHIQIFHTMENGILFSRIIPGKSDFQAGWMRWEIKEMDSYKIHPVTRIILDIEMVPDFFVPPVIGPYQIKKIMLGMARATIINLEKKAKTNPPG